jgi:hypothetical protein
LSLATQEDIVYSLSNTLALQCLLGEAATLGRLEWPA